MSLLNRQSLIYYGTENEFAKSSSLHELFKKPYHNLFEANCGYIIVNL